MDFNRYFIESENKDLKVLIHEVSQIMYDYNYNTFSFCDFKFKGFYRARKHNHELGYLDIKNNLCLFSNEIEFWEVPKDRAKLGRCNDSFESIFYCSSDLVTSILEVKPEIGSYVTIANFKNIDDQNIPHFNIHPIGKKYLSTLNELEELFKNVKLDLQQNLLDDFLDNLFHIDVKDGEEFKYKLSIAVSKICLSNGINRFGQLFETDGLLYSSIVRNKNSYCFALKPWLVHSYFKIFSLQTLLVLEKGDNFIKVKLLRNGRPKFKKIYLNNLFDIEWFNPPLETPEFEILYF